MKKFLLLALSVLSLETALAQHQNANQHFAYLNSGLLDGRTIVKANLTSLAFKSYGFYAERFLGRRLSLQVGYSFRPADALPFVSAWGKSVSEISTAQIGYKMFTPELRLYLGKGYGRGFYLSPYYRYESYNLSGVNIDISNSSTNGVKNASFSGTTQSHGVGLAIGAQWLIGKKKNIVIDWTIFGMHYAKAKTTLSSVLDQAGAERFSKEDQQNIKDEVEGMFDDLSFIGLSQNNVNVTFDSDAKGAYRGNISAKHPFAWLRANLSIGFRF